MGGEAAERRVHGGVELAGVQVGGDGVLGVRSGEAAKE